MRSGLGKISFILILVLVILILSGSVASAQSPEFDSVRLTHPEAIKTLSIFLVTVILFSLVSVFSGQWVRVSLRFAPFLLLMLAFLVAGRVEYLAVIMLWWLWFEGLVSSLEFFPALFNSLFKVSGGD